MKRLGLVVSVFSLFAALGLWSLPGRPAASRRTSTSASPECTWLAGDLHAQAASEVGSIGLSLDELASNAEARGLDYLLVADPNRLTAVADPAFGSAGLAWFIGYEKATGGERDKALVLGGEGLAFSDSGDRSRDLVRIASAVRRGQGIVELARPEAALWSIPLVKRIQPETVEVWRGGPFSYRTPGLAKSPAAALKIYDDLLDHGIRAAVSGGSDTSNRALSDVAGVGQPTTWVCAEATDAMGVARGVDLGRTSISHETPALKGPLVYLEGDADGDGTFEARMGDEVPSGTSIRMTAKNAPAAKIRLISDGSVVVDELIVDSFDFSKTLKIPDNVTWVRAELFLDETLQKRKVGCSVDEKPGDTVTYCEGAFPMLGLTSPIYVRNR